MPVSSVLPALLVFILPENSGIIGFPENLFTYSFLNNHDLLIKFLKKITMSNFLFRSSMIFQQAIVKIISKIGGLAKASVGTFFANNFF